MPQALEKSAHLLRLAESASQANGRLGDIYVAVATLVEHDAPTLSARERELAADICKRLSKDVEMSIRLSLAERIADNDEAPRELVLLLADDRIEVARPVLLRSRALTDADLVRIVNGGSADHQVAIASRSDIAEAVSAALAQSHSDGVVIALTQNKTAKIARETFEILADRARSSSFLHAPLAERADLPHAAAARLFGIVSEALKTALVQRYPAVASALSRAIDESTHAVREGNPATSESNAAKLVAKLAQGGQLRASVLIRALYQAQMDLFEHGFATLLGLDIERLRQALYGGKPRLTAMACRAAGIDRCVFSTVFNLSHHHRKERATLSDADLRDVEQVFTGFSRVEALAALKAALSN